MPLKYLFGERLGRDHLQPAAARHQVCLEVGGGAYEHLIVGVAVGGFDFLLGVVDGQVAHVVLFHAKGLSSYYFGSIHNSHLLIILCELIFDDFPGAAFAFGAAYDSLLCEAGGDGFDSAPRFAYLSGNKLLWSRWVLLYHSQYGDFFQSAVFALCGQTKGKICTCKCQFCTLFLC